MIATPPITLSWHVIFRHDEYEKNLFVSPRRCYHILSLTSESLLRHTFSQRLHKHITEEVTKFILKLLCMTLLQDSSLLVGVDS